MSYQNKDGRGNQCTHIFWYLTATRALRYLFSMTHRPTYGTHTLILGCVCRKQSFHPRSGARQDLLRLFPPPGGLVILQIYERM